MLLGIIMLSKLQISIRHSLLRCAVTCSGLRLYSIAGDAGGPMTAWQLATAVLLCCVGCRLLLLRQLLLVRAL